MQQFLQSLDMMRNGCMSKFNVDIAILDRIRDGDFDLEPTKDLMVRRLLKLILKIVAIQTINPLVLYKVRGPAGGHPHQEGGVECA